MSLRSSDDLAIALEALRALSDETRFRIAAMLGSGPMTVSEIAEELEASQPLISFHLGKLRTAGLVAPRRRGQWVSYALDRRVVTRLQRFVGDLVRYPPSYPPA